MQVEAGAEMRRVGEPGLRRKKVELRSLQPVKEIRKILESKGKFGEEEEY